MERTRSDELRILIFGAQADDRILLCRQLPGLPERTFVSEEASSGEEAVEKLGISLQCILLDYALPGSGGVGSRECACCERIRQRIEIEKFASDRDLSFSLTVSFGLCQCSAQHVTMEALLSDADRALYGAKNQGGNQVYLSVDGRLLAWAQATGLGSVSPQELGI